MDDTITVKSAKQWAKGQETELNAGRLACDDESVQMFNRIMPEKSKELWDSGVWLAEQLRSHGATDEQISSIQMAAVQRAFCGDAWQASVDYANEFAEHGDTEEKGGFELDVKRHKELYGSSI